MTIPRVERYSALLISSEIADIIRFPDHERLCSYAEPSPEVHQSGDMQYTFQRPRELDAEVDNDPVHPHQRPRVRLDDKEVLQSGQREEKVAIAATARKHMDAMYIMLKEEKSFRLNG